MTEHIIFSYINLGLHPPITNHTPTIRSYLYILKYSTRSMAGTSDTLDASARIDDLKHASNANVSNIVSVKLSSEHNYHLWKTQMYCLMKTYKMAGIVDDKFVGPSTSNKEILDQYDSLLKGWILGSTSENVLGAVVDLESAKDVWDKLKSFYGTTTTHQQAATKSEAKYITEDIDAVMEDTHRKGEDTLEKEIDSEHVVSTENIIEGEGAGNVKDTIPSQIMRHATINGDWMTAENLLKAYTISLASEVVTSDGNTALHIAVGLGHNDFVRNLLMFYLNDEQVLKKRDSDGSTALHIAAIVGNTHATDLLVKKNKALLHIKDLKGEEPLHKAYENMHLDTIGYLLKAINDDDDVKGKEQSSHIHLGIEIGVDLLVNAISAKQYNFASDLIKRFPKFASKSDDVLMAIARTFPTELDYWQTLFYPSYDLDDISNTAVTMLKFYFMILFYLPVLIYQYIYKDDRSYGTWFKTLLRGLLITVPMWLLSIFLLIPLCIIMVWLLFVVFYYALWKGIDILGGPTKHIEKKKKDWNEATNVLRLVCHEIGMLEFSGTHHPYFTRPLLEAASQNAYIVVDEILHGSPEAIQSTDKSGYDIIQLAIIHRSEKIYNLIYDFGERKNLYRTLEDSSKNNILHLAARLAPSHELSRRRGAALQLQRELQWREEVKKHIFPTYITRENIFKETPDMLFTREHEMLLKEGENWMKATSESCSITAALIATIMFAAAITVPGGNDQTTGIPLFSKYAAFIIFAVTDAISLFASSTALLVFLSILTARFAENDFLVSLPSRMLIGLVALLLSTIAMMVAFSATLFLVFCHQKLWMLAPICVLAFIPIGFFVVLQFPLIVDLFRSTYLPIFGNERRNADRRLNRGEVRLLFLSELIEAGKQRKNDP
ncbi:uncharacterized protein [Rutidosis leptorrhynchoides]|uniref:uncharacterized protein isoform X2 n=1 Tax=Rutidosis leptorrhynchoides TaxID=125765 RepID=UPI003A99B3BB